MYINFLHQKLEGIQGSALQKIEAHCLEPVKSWVSRIKVYEKAKISKFSMSKSEVPGATMHF